jgi:hypothetical protein
VKKQLLLPIAASRIGPVFCISFFLLPSSFCLSAEPMFTAQSAFGAPATGAVTRIESNGAVVLQGDAPVTIPGPDLIALRRIGKLLPPPPAGPQVVFANGDCLAGEVLAIENDAVRFKANFGPDGVTDLTQELSIPLSALAVLWLQAPPAATGEELARGWARERRRRDMVLSKNGDTRTGIVKQMKSASTFLLLREDEQETRIDPFQLVAIVMNTDLARVLRPRGQYMRLVLANGARIGFASAAADARTLSGKTLFGAEVKIPLEQIVSIDVRQGKAVYVSDLKPKSYEHTPFLGVRWPYEMDRSVAGNALRLAGNAFDKGIGMHSESRLTFDLGGQYHRFEALVGLDDRTGRGGRVKIRVLVDGKDRDIGDPNITSATAPRAVQIDASGGKELTLVVEFGSNGDVCDHVDWADARLVK